MTDQELLKLAAKAEGHRVTFDEISGLTWFDDKYSGLLWNPLHVDGDALRLAVALRLDLTFYNGFQEVHSDSSLSDGLTPSIQPYGSDIESAARRAIVLAAAEIGKSMEKSQ